jgi:protein-L-isoaspartate(D-aspartate) O-methyltransferase
VNGACEKMADPVLSQLAEGGRLCAVIGGRSDIGVATMFVKSGGIVSSRVLFNANVPRLPEFELEEGFTF